MFSFPGWVGHHAGASAQALVSIAKLMVSLWIPDSVGLVVVNWAAEGLSGVDVFIFILNFEAF